MLVPLSNAYLFGGQDVRTSSPGATMSGLIRVPWNDAGPRLLNVASPSASIARQPIHCAPGATPILFDPPSSPTTVPSVAVPWPFESMGVRLPAISSNQL